jgi:membrane-bound serine protease (ClpP class)
MNLIIILFSAGIVLLALEVFMPGAILGILGGAAMVLGCVVAFSKLGMAGGFTALGIAFALLGLTMFLEFYLLPRTRLGRQMFVHSTSGADQQPLASEELLGRQAEALTILAPSGYVSVDGRRYEAFCQTGHAPKGAVLRVTGRDSFRLLVSI